MGTFAVQIAKSFGAEVTGVCSTGNVELVRSLGADRVIDYKVENFTKGSQRYGIVFDCVGNHSLSATLRILTREGTYLMVGEMSGRGLMGILARLAAALALSKFVSQKLIVFLARPNKTDLMVLHDLMKAGKVIPIIDRRYELSEIPAAIRYLQGKHARGKIVITLRN